jgi:hypothetical protein
LYSMAKKCQNTIGQSFSYNSWIRCLQTHVDMDIFLILVYGMCAQSMSEPFSHILYVWHTSAWGITWPLWIYLYSYVPLFQNSCSGWAVYAWTSCSGT